MSSNHDINGAALAELDADTSGPVLTAGEDRYDDARRVWNGRFDRRPAVISRCRNRDDIGAAVDFARSQGLPLAVKGGGHDYGGNPARDDSVLIDCSAMDSVTVDPEAQVARVGPGVTWAEFDEQAQEHGLATTGATVSSVGVAGYTLGGGTGHLARTHGLAADNLRAAEVVTANGEAVRASEDRHPELFWALRGGSGNFGVVTEFEFDLHPVGPEILAGQVIHPSEDAPEVLRHYRSFMAEAPAEVNCYAFVIPIPPLPAFPEEIHGDPAVDLVAAYSGDIEAGEDALAPLREFGNPILDGIRRQPYTELQQAFDDGAPKGERWYSKAQYLDELTDYAIDAFIDATDPLRGPMTMVYLDPMGGAIAEVDAAATAFPHRDAAYSVHALTGWSDPDRDGELIEWTDSVHETMAPYSSGGVYVNLLNRTEGDRVPEAFGANYERLREVKADWDPENLFDSNQNIEPAG
jgi:FAD/FMN-containing dehydrogenase